MRARWIAPSRSEVSWPSGQWLGDVLIGLVGVVEGDAGGHDLNEREALVLDGALEHLVHYLPLRGEGAPDERRAVHQRVANRVDRHVMRAVRRGLRAHRLRRGRGDLPLRQAVDLVVHHDGRDVEVAACGVRQVARADGEVVAVAAECDHREVRSRHLDAGGGGQRATMDAVVAVGIDEAGEAAGAADAGDDTEIVLIHVHRDERFVERREDAEVAAPRAPDRAQAGTVMCDRFRFLSRSCCRDHCSS